MSRQLRSSVQGLKIIIDKCNLANTLKSNRFSIFDNIKKDHHILPIHFIYNILMEYIYLVNSGNIVIILSILKTKELRTTTNIFLASIAATDFFNSLFTIGYSVSTQSMVILSVAYFERRLNK